jgi:hypothetical protein
MGLILEVEFDSKEVLEYVNVWACLECWVRCRLCSDYEAWGASGNYKARGASGNYEAWGVSGRKYEARMVIFRILAAVNRFFLDFLERGKPLRKIRKPLRKIGKPLKKAESR